MPNAVLVAIVGVPVVLLMLLRINAAIVFLSVCLGYVLVQFVGPDAVTFSRGFVAQNSPTATAGVRLAVLLAPVFITMLFMVRTVRPHKLLINLLLSLGVGLLLLLVIEPLLTPGLAHNIVRSSLWSQVVKGQDLIVGVSALICLASLIMQRPKSEEHKKKR